MRGRLGIFQQHMLRWNEIHPYNAVHVAQIRGVLDAARLRACLRQTLERHGLGLLVVDSGEGTYQYQGGPAEFEMRTVVAAEEAHGVLAAEIERQLNLRFDATRPFSPFRFFVAPAVDAFHLGLAYFHPAADAESVVGLLKDMVAAYLQKGGRVFGESFDPHPDHRAHLLRRHSKAVVHKLLALPGQVRNLRQSYRVRHGDSIDTANGFVYFSLSPENLRAVMAASESWKVTVNDLLMALLMKALSPCAAGRAQARKRRKLSVGCIVNLRRDLPKDGRQTFGLSLGSFTVTHEVPFGIGLRELAVDIAAQTLPIKRHKLYLATPLELGFAGIILHFFSLDRRKKFYPKYFPLWGGISNMNLNRLWDPNSGNAPMDYARGVSTGPVTPLALSATTVGEHLNIGVSYRTAVFSREEIDRLERIFREELAALPAAA